MRILTLLPLMILIGCSSGPSKSEALQVFAAATTTMASAQSRAITDAETSAIAAPVVYALDFSGPCTLGGTVGVTGSYDASGTADRSSFDLTAAFRACQEAQGTLDGSLRWTSVAEGETFRATMTGDLDFDGPEVSASCDFDLTIGVTAQSVTYSGQLCGYSLAELGVATR
jgi:hypothetical protein